MRDSDFWANMETYIFFTTSRKGWAHWSDRWDVLMFDNKPVTDMQTAIQLIKESGWKYNVGLANFEQMGLRNTQWDNI